MKQLKAVLLFLEFMMSMHIWWKIMLSIPKQMQPLWGPVSDTMSSCLLTVY